MKLVTFSEAMAPHGAGDTRLVPDAVAAELESAGAISSSIDWPPAPDNVPSPAGARPKAPTKPARAMPQPSRRAVPDQRVAR